MKQRFIAVGFLLMLGSGFVSEANQPTQSNPGIRPEWTQAAAITAALGLTQAFIPHRWESQRLFPENVNPLDRSVRNHWHTKSDNFLDSKVGSVTTPVVAGAALAGLYFVEEAPYGVLANDVALFLNGAAANGLLTKALKKTFSRRRPLLEFATPENRAQLDASASNHESFPSGHSSSAFFAASYLQRRVSEALTDHGHAGIRSGYQWLTGIGLYGWASYVAYSRIQIDKHYFTDVAMGASMGVLFEAVYYRLSQKRWTTQVARTEALRSGTSWTFTPRVSLKSAEVYLVTCF